MEHGCPPAVGLDALGREGPEGAIQMENFKLFFFTRSLVPVSDQKPSFCSCAVRHELLCGVPRRERRVVGGGGGGEGAAGRGGGVRGTTLLDVRRGLKKKGKLIFP